tara:strand:+ start:290 stop:1078 length:789 start_codon:yes stop_codon:yes gene_type:complete
VIKAKKSLGQNFLIDQNLINKIIDTININNQSVLEVGPGTGKLTEKILEKNPEKLIVIEKDNELALFIKNNFGPRVKVINQDVLKVDENLLHNEKLIVFGNLPYNISTEILCKWILNIDNQNFWFSHLVLMFQKEVADRVIAKPNTKNYGRLSIISNWKLKIKKICDVKPSSFSPKPKIDSTVLYFEPKENFLKLKDSKNLEKITRVFFAHRRKMIKKPFNLLFNGNENIIQKLKINLNLRPQNLDFATYFKLAEEYEKLSS